MQLLHHMHAQFLHLLERQALVPNLVSERQRNKNNDYAGDFAAAAAHDAAVADVAGLSPSGQRRPSCGCGCDLWDCDCGGRARSYHDIPTECDC